VLADGFHVIPATRAEFDITDLAATQAFIRKTEPHVVIHPAAYTNVDGCETNKEKAFLVNAIGAQNVAIVTREIEAKLVFISTDYVFDGEKKSPYLEYDSPNPLSVYGWSKLMGERMVMQQNPRSFILRISWLYGPHGKNFVKTMLSLARTKKELQVVNDQRGTPTFAGDIAHQIQALIQTDSYGLYHCTSQGSCTWYEFALEIFKNAGYRAEPGLSGSIHLIPNPESLIPTLPFPIPNTQDLTPNPQSPRPILLTPVTTEQFPRPAQRPQNSVLENFMLKIQGLDIMPPWQESLKKFMKSIDGRQSVVGSQKPTVKRQQPKG
jgi:dTDP-4-dehydrorhamnose reductase